MKKSTKALVVTILSIVGMGGLTACGNDASSSDTTAMAVPSQPEITVTGQWARQSPMATDMGAAYLVINSNMDDELIGAMVDTSVAGMTQVHETIMGEGDSMKMQEVEKIAIRAGTPTELKPGGLTTSC